ncbi:MAG: hypothetical protein LBR54_02395, partial [Oscillospiraceae bacterium]|nr:hypothetical protein [Oscillospiraceae bacterium]
LEIDNGEYISTIKGASRVDRGKVTLYTVNGSELYKMNGNKDAYIGQPLSQFTNLSTMSFMQVPTRNFAVNPAFYESYGYEVVFGTPVYNDKGGLVNDYSGSLSVDDPGYDEAIHGSRQYNMSTFAKTMSITINAFDRNTGDKLAAEGLWGATNQYITASFGLPNLTEPGTGNIRKDFLLARMPTKILDPVNETLTTPTVPLPTDLAKFPDDGSGTAGIGHLDMTKEEWNEALNKENVWISEGIEIPLWADNYTRPDGTPADPKTLDTDYALRFKHFFKTSGEAVYPDPSEWNTDPDHGDWGTMLDSAGNPVKAPYRGEMNQNSRERMEHFTSATAGGAVAETGPFSDGDVDKTGWTGGTKTYIIFTLPKHLSID